MRPDSNHYFRLAAALGVSFTLAANLTAHAGDILRGGAVAGSRPNSGAGANPNAARTEQIRTNAQDALKRSTQAVQAVKAMQDAARNLAVKGPSSLALPGGRALPKVPNGLVLGGLQVARGVPVNLGNPTAGEDSKLWQGALLPKQTTLNGRTLVTIEQQKPQALLTWETFNIGKETTLRFNQGRGGADRSEWIAFNKVNDPSGVPSQILGSIEALGQVYVINRNGIIFGGASQVNTRTFVASTLPINDNLIQQGLLNNRDAQFLFSALPVPGGSDGTPAFNPTISDREFRLAADALSYTLVEPVAVNATNVPLRTPEFTFKAGDGSKTKLVAGTDYNLTVDATSKKATATFTAAGLAKVGAAGVSVIYTPVTVKTGDVFVQAGAKLSSPGSDDGNGGRVMLVGTNVKNEGTISTPAGQTILAAGQQVAVAAHASNDPSLRGLDVWIGAAEKGTGTATNSGLIEAFSGSVSMSGREVNQLGVIESSTTVNLNGRIDLRASYGAVANPGFDNTGEGFGKPQFVLQQTGTVAFGEGSTTRILPDYASEKMVPGTALPERSQINVEGLAVHFEKGATMLAPNAEVTIAAGIWPYKDLDGNRTIFNAEGQPEARLSSFFSGSAQRFLFSDGQIYLSDEAEINVAGSADVFVPLAHSILEVEFRGSELADSPVQRTGLLRGVPLTVDLRRSGVMGGRYWMGTPLGDVTGLAGLIERNVAQLTAEGGRVTLQAGNSIVLQPGAAIDVSGGSYRHEAGMVKTSRLMQFGRLVDIAGALPGQIYDGLYTGQFTQTSQRWGVSETFTVPFMTGEHFEQSFVQGAAGGAITMKAPGMAIDGELRGLTAQDERGRSVTPQSSLSIAFAGEKAFEPNATDLYFLSASPTPPAVTFSTVKNQASVEAFRLLGGTTAPLAGDRLASVVLSPELLGERGFGKLSVENVEGNITVPVGVQLAAPPLGGVTLIGANVSVLGEVSAPGGELKFTAFNISPTAAAEFPLVNPQGALAPLPNAGRGLFTLGPGATLNTSGLIVDDRQGVPGANTEPLVIDGGSVSIMAFSADLAEGSTIDVSGGVAVNGRSTIRFGRGGSMTIRTGKDPGFGRVIGGSIELGSTLAGYSGGRGGALTIQASAIQIGGSAPPNTLLLAPEFFRQGGFTSFTLEGIGAPSDAPAGPGEPETYQAAITIAPGTRIEPVAESWDALPVLSGTSEVVLRRTLNPVELRSPVSLSFAALGADDSFTANILEVRGDIVMGAGAAIVTDPGASVSFKGQTVTLLGSVTAPGGSIAVEGAGAFPVAPDFRAVQTAARPTVYLGPRARLDAAGTSLITIDSLDRRSGSVLPGGTISIAGNILADRGAVLDVSGTSAVVDLHPWMLGAVADARVPLSSGLTAPLWQLETVPVRIDSDAGTIVLQGSELLLSDATLLGVAGGPEALGGALSVSSGRFYAAGNAQFGSDINLVVKQSGETIALTNQARGIGRLVLDAAGVALPGMGYFAVDRFIAGGFDSLDLGYSAPLGASLAYGGNVRFDGPVVITARGALRVASGGVMEADSAVSLRAPYVAIGQNFSEPLHPDDVFLSFRKNDPANPGAQHFLPPTFGSGSFTVSAGLIDAGTTVFQNVGKVALLARGGDIRGNGTLSLSGSLLLDAAQIYPTTLSDFNIFAYDDKAADGTVLHSGSVTIRRSGTGATPLAAGGNLGIFASEIKVGGVLRVPLGTITLGWDGTDLDPSDADLDAPLNPTAGTTVASPIAKSVTLTGGSTVSVAAMDGVSGSELLIPYGVSPDGSSWIDPRGVNVTLNGLSEKRIVISGDKVVAQRGSTVDIRGGGELMGFRWVPGSGGSVDILGTAGSGWVATNEYEPGDLVTSGGRTYSARVRHTGQKPTPSLYWTEVAESYAVVPSFSAGFAPYARFNTGTNSESGGDPGYVSSTLKIGDRIYLDGGAGLAAGTYTLLPRRYALMPGAFLVTPTSRNPLGEITMPDGSTYVSGYSFNGFNQPGEMSSMRTQFEIASSEVVRNRAAYDEYLGNSFFTAAAARFDAPQVQRLPIDSGYAAFHGNIGLRPDGMVLTGRPQTGRGAAVDLSSFADLYVVGGSGTVPAGATAVVKNSVVNSWGVESLLIGGLRHQTATGTTIDVRTSNLVLDNPGALLHGPDITLASKAKLTVTDGSAMAASGRLSEAATFFTIKGDGALLRTSRDLSAGILRTGVTDATTPLLTIGAGALVVGSGVIVDSTYGTQLDPTTTLKARALTLGSGQISIVLEQPSGGLIGSVVDPHLVLAGDLLEDVQQVGALTLRSYRTIDIYGAGTFGSDALGSLSLLAGGVRGFGQGAGTALFEVGSMTLSNPSNVAALAAPAVASGNLQIDAKTVRLGENTFSVTGYENVAVNATGRVLGVGKGAFTTPGNLTITTPLIIGARGSTHAVTAGGALVLERSAGSSEGGGGLGASFTFTGTSVLANTTIRLPSGQITLRATTGDLRVGGDLDVAGTMQRFDDLLRYTNAGSVTLTADAGTVTLDPESRVSVSAANGGGKAGTVIVNAPKGAFVLEGATLVGAAGAGQTSGSFVLDAGSLPSYTGLAAALDTGGFFEQRNLRVRTGDIVIANPAGGSNVAREFIVSADVGSIRVTGAIDASGVTGGRIALIAGGDLILADGSILTAHAQQFSSAGKGGEIHLEAGAAVNGVANLAALLEVQSGSTIDLGVDAFVPGEYTTPGSSAFYGQFTGTLHLRAPRTAGNNDLRIAPIAGTITGASSVVAEGFEIVDLTGAGGLITGWRPAIATLPSAGTIQRTVYDSANAFLSAGNYNAMLARLLGADAQGLGARFVIAPGAEIINRSGDLTLGLANGTSLGSAALNSADWNLSDFRFGPKQAPGILTLRAAGNLVFNNALSDGFTPVAATSANGNSQLWLGQLKNIDPLLPTNVQSWSFRLTAGADLGSASSARVNQTLVGGASGSVLVGQFYAPVPNPNPSTPSPAIGSEGLTANTIRISTSAADLGTRYEVIRTGTGSITINAASDVQLRNQFATIYTAGVRIPVPQNLFGTGDFRPPTTFFSNVTHPDQGTLGLAQQAYGPLFVDEAGINRRTAQYALSGGAISLDAGRNIGRYSGLDGAGNLIVSSSRQLPMNWLYRRGSVDPSTGLFGAVTVDSYVDPVASTTWWIDYSNFFEGIGTLGGGDISLIAGGDIVNADAVIPTNARMAGRDPVTGLNLAPDASRLVEHGGGDLVVTAGRNIDGGAYYLERGRGLLSAGGEITTNAARSPSLGTLSPGAPEVFDARTWLPTTLFVGKAQFDVSARGDVLLGPMANPFLLPAGLGNKLWYRTYFSTYSPDASVDVASFGGSVTHRMSVTLPEKTQSQGALYAWLDTQNLFNSAALGDRASIYQPWIRLAEFGLETTFNTTTTIQPPTLRSTAFAGDINVVGPLNLFPSATGTLELVASGGIIGLQPTGIGRTGGVDATAWATAKINLSDASPSSVNSIASPSGVLPSGVDYLGRVFNETGSFAGANAAEEVKRFLHDPAVLHAADAEPVRLYAAGGDITGVTLFVPKQARIHAERDITDVALYVQNANAESISVVSAGRDIIPSNANSALRSVADDIARGNYIADLPRATVRTQGDTAETTTALAGDIQISGPGVLEVLAGRNLDLGSGANFTDGTGVGVTSIGNFRNPFLPFAGANIIALAGVGGVDGGAALGLSGSSLDFESFITQFTASSSQIDSQYLDALDLDGKFSSLTAEQQAITALEVFYAKLKEAGRSFPETGNYESGTAAIETLFGTAKREGEIFTQARDIRSSTGGTISLGAPGGALTMASDIFGNPLTPPGIVTEYGGAISIFTNGDVDIGQARIFTLRGGDMLIWSSTANIAAGTAARTVVTAPPTRVLIDVTSANVETDLGGLATGGGIGVLASVAGVTPGDVDLIAPQGVVDAGDAGIRVTGNLNIAATAVLNASSISVAGSSSGVPSTPTVAAPNIAGLSAANAAAGASSAAANTVTQQQGQEPAQEEAPSTIVVEVIGFGGGEG